MEPLQFFLPMERVPTVTHQEKRIGIRKNGKPYTYDSPEVAAARDLFESALWPWKPKEKYQGAIRLTVKWLFPATKKQTKSWQWKITKPDTDNLIKLLKDVMTAQGFWNDDAQVCSEIVEKFTVTGNTGIWISVESIE